MFWCCMGMNKIIVKIFCLSLKQGCSYKGSEVSWIFSPFYWGESGAVSSGQLINQSVCSWGLGDSDTWNRSTEGKAYRRAMLGKQLEDSQCLFPEGTVRLQKVVFQISMFSCLKPGSLSQKPNPDLQTSCQWLTGLFFPNVNTLLGHKQKEWDLCYRWEGARSTPLMLQHLLQTLAYLKVNLRLSSCSSSLNDGGMSPFLNLFSLKPDCLMLKW